MRLISISILAVFVGCHLPQQTFDPSLPEILVQQPLPEIPASMINPPQEISLALYITAEGYVTKVHILKGSCGPAWDTLAIQTIMAWQFIPARVNNEPISTWFRLHAPIRYIRTLSFELAEIANDHQGIMDSIYEKLSHGYDFGELAERFSIDSSHENKGILGDINVYRYPESIRKHILNLEPNEFTRPLKHGEYFIIFKRLKH